MSQHIFETTNAEKERLTVTMGYDRPLNYVFCTVMTEDGDVIYSNLDDDQAGISQQDVGYYRTVLRNLELQIPESMYRETQADQVARVGNRVQVHPIVGQSEELGVDI
jgi:hypothetical protein